MVHQYGPALSKWFQDANSEYDVIFDCVKSLYLLFGIDIGFVDVCIGWPLTQLKPVLCWFMCIKMPGDWLANVERFL